MPHEEDAGDNDILRQFFFILFYFFFIKCKVLNWSVREWDRQNCGFWWN